MYVSTTTAMIKHKILVCRDIEYQYQHQFALAKYMTIYNSHNQYAITFLTWLWNKNQYALPILSLSYFTLSCTRREYKNLDDKHSSFNTSWNLKKFSNSDSCCMTLPSVISQNHTFLSFFQEIRWHFLYRKIYFAIFSSWSYSCDGSVQIDCRKKSYISNY